MRKELKDTIAVSRSRDLALAAVFGALYAALVVTFASISNLPIQVRVADVLLPLTVLFGPPAIIGLGIGTVVGNFAADSLTGFPSGSIGLDIVGGTAANLLAGFLAWKLGQRSWKLRNFRVDWFIATLVETALISLVVGGYLSVVFPSTAMALSIVGVLVGEIIAINFGGFALLTVMGRERSLSLLRSRGLQLFGASKD